MMMLLYLVALSNPYLALYLNALKTKEDEDEDLTFWPKDFLQRHPSPTNCSHELVAVADVALVLLELIVDHDV